MASWTGITCAISDAPSGGRSAALVDAEPIDQRHDRHDAERVGQRPRLAGGLAGDPPGHADAAAPAAGAGLELPQEVGHVEGGVHVVAVLPTLEGGGALAAAAGHVVDDRLLGGLDVDLGPALGVGPHQGVGHPVDEGVGVRDLAVGVEAVALPNLPGVRVAGVVAEAEPGHVEALLDGIDYERAPVVGELGEQSAEGAAPLLRGVDEALLALVVVAQPGQTELALIELQRQMGEDVERVVVRGGCPEVDDGGERHRRRRELPPAWNDGPSTRARARRHGGRRRGRCRWRRPSRRRGGWRCRCGRACRRCAGWPPGRGPSGRGPWAGSGSWGGRPDPSRRRAGRRSWRRPSCARPAGRTPGREAPRSAPSSSAAPWCHGDHLLRTTPRRTFAWLQHCAARGPGPSPRPRSRRSCRSSAPGRA